MAKFSDQRRLLVQPDGQIIESPRGRLFIDAYTAKMTDLSGGAFCAAAWIPSASCTTG